MGYYTYYSLDMEGSKPGDVEKIVDFVKQNNNNQNKYNDFNYAFKPYEEGFFGDNVKWYSHEEDMIQISKEFPHILFVLHGEGEDSEDLWYQYFQDGKTQFCPAEIVYEDYDPKKMKEPWHEN